MSRKKPPTRKVGPAHADLVFGKKESPLGLAAVCFRGLQVRYGTDAAIAAFDSVAEKARQERGVRGASDPIGDLELLRKFDEMPKRNIAALARKIEPENEQARKALDDRLRDLLRKRRLELQSMVADDD